VNVTNNSGLPDQIVRLVSGGDRVRKEGVVSVTTLIRPPQQNALEKEYEDDITEDAADRIWAAYGTLMHLAIERSAEEHDEAIQELTFELPFDNWIVTGTPDHYQAGVLSDFKFTSVWSVIDGVKPDWEEQLNFYAHLLKQNGYPVDSIQIIALYRDWSKTRAHEQGYPQQQVAIHKVNLWDDEFTHGVMQERLDAYKEAMAGRSRPCTPEERWHRPDTWAVVKKGNKRASRVLPTMKDAIEWARNQTDKEYYDVFNIEFRAGEDTRCDNYCRVAAFCPQYRAVVDTRMERLADKLAIVD